MSAYGQQASSLMNFCASMNAEYHQLLKTGHYRPDEINEDTEAAYRAVMNGATVQSQADKLGIAGCTLARRFRVRGLELSKPIEVDIEVAKRMYAEGESVAAIARHFNVSYTPIRKRLLDAGVKLHRGKKITLIGPDGNEYAVQGVREFVESNTDLFSDEDLELKTNSQGYTTHKAVFSLNSSITVRKPWKGWKVK